MRDIRVPSSILFAALLLSFVPTSQAATSAVSVTLRWTAPGDDGLAGRATRYDLRYSKTLITAANFASATVVNGIPQPRPGGLPDSFSVTGLTSGTGYYFALKTLDEVNNTSAISNVVYRALPVVRVEQPPLSLSFSGPWPNPARESAQFAYTLPAAASVQMDAFDISGRHVRALEYGVREAGRKDLVWDLRDDSGRRVQAGVYFVHMRTTGASWVRRLVVSS